VEHNQQMRVAYVGLTEHLWLATKGDCRAAVRAVASGTDGHGMPERRASASTSTSPNNSEPGAWRDIGFARSP
jgi:hypothetical protein